MSETGGVNIRIELSKSELDYVTKRLEEAKAKAPQSIRNVLNRVAREARKKIVQQARQIYYFRPGFRIGNIKLHPATPSVLVATLEAQTKPRTAKKYQYRVLKAGVKIGVLRSGGPSFMGEKGRATFENPQNGLIMIRKGKSRLPLHAARGPSEANMYKQAWEGANGTQPLAPLIERALRREMQAEIRNVL